LTTIRAAGDVLNPLEDAILEIGEPRLRAIARLRAGVVVQPAVRLNGLDRWCCVTRGALVGA
jgi:hypothetical protein